VAEVRVNGVRLHVQRLGKGGPPVVFLHGLVMDNLSSWYFTAAGKVAATADAILFDLRGHGRSERPTNGYSVEVFLDDLDALLDALAVRAPVAGSKTSPHRSTGPSQGRPPIQWVTSASAALSLVVVAISRTFPSSAPAAATKTQVTNIVAKISHILCAARFIPSLLS